MAFCLTVPSHYRNLYWLVKYMKTLKKDLQWNWNRIAWPDIFNLMECIWKTSFICNIFRKVIYNRIDNCDVYVITYTFLSLKVVFSCDQSALWMVFSVRLSVCPSVRLSVCPSVRLSVLLSHLFDYVPIIVSSWNFQELSPRTRVRSMQKVKVRGQRSRSQRSRPNFSFPDCNSSLNSHMMMKWYI